MFAGEPAPTGPARLGAAPPLFPVAAIDDPVLPEVLAELAAARADAMDADTVNRELSIARKAIGWWQRQGWIDCDPTIGIERRPAPPDRTKALAENQIAALWCLDVALREKTCWKMLYESAARADEVLCLNVEDLHPGDKRGRTLAKGGATEWIHWQSGTAQLLPRLIAGRTRGPLFLTGRKAPAGTPTLDVCPETGRARLSYRRAEEIFEENTRLLANPLASPEDIEDLDGFTLHRLRHSALTHDAEGGTNTPMLLARSRHASVRGAAGASRGRQQLLSWDVAKASAPNAEQGGGGRDHGQIGQQGTYGWPHRRRCGHHVLDRLAGRGGFMPAGTAGAQPRCANGCTRRADYDCASIRPGARVDEPDHDGCPATQGSRPMQSLAARGPRGAGQPGGRTPRASWCNGAVRCRFGADFRVSGTTVPGGIEQ
ncbi:tyrosine-type recombinase/integrase [Streptomyces sp. 24-1644]|uniref:tyrosine-type recombinase/integrase n=1 Tax=Streptomyces sp. 24-1644 TaxID=3457315 RepID=UPI003FA7CC64